MELGAGVCCQGTVPNIKVYASCIVDEEWDCRKRPAEIHKPGGSSPSKYGSYPLNRRHSSRSASRSTTPGTRFLSTRRKSVRPLTAWRTLRWISSSPFVASTYRLELGVDHHDRLHPLRSTRRLVERLAGLGFEVELRPKEPAVQEVQPETSVPRKRGRPKGSKNRHPYTRSYPAPSKPCSKCATRGIPCIHQPPSTPTDPPAHCRQCATWGLPACIHAKNFFKAPSNRSPSEDPAT